MLIEALITLLPILGVLIVGIISPGPSFLLVARTAVGSSRSGALASAFGMATGAAILAVAALLGLHVLLQEMPRAYVALKIAGGAYLIFLAIRTWRAAGSPVLDSRSDDPCRASLTRHFCIALGTMLSNPKAAVQYGVLFAAMLPATMPVTTAAALPVAVFVLEALWYVFVACALSATRPRDLYLSTKWAADRIVGGLLGALGVRLVVASR